VVGQLFTDILICPLCSNQGGIKTALTGLMAEKVTKRITNVLEAVSNPLGLLGFSIQLIPLDHLGRQLKIGRAHNYLKTTCKDDYIDAVENAGR
jgi:hypothetical protein